MVSNVNAKCFASVRFSESLNIMFIHLDSPFSFVQFLILLILITPILLYSFLFIKESLASLSPLQIKKITFVSCTTNEQINKLSIIKQYLYRWVPYLDNFPCISLSWILISMGLFFQIRYNFEGQQFKFHQLFDKTFFL